MPEATAKNPDIDMSDEYAVLIPGAKQYPFKVPRFHVDNALLGLEPKLVQLVKENPSDYLVVVVYPAQAWLLSGIIQCLSDIDPDIWDVMEATTNFGEAQHAANTETGIGMALPQYEALDTQHAAEIELGLQSENLNEVSDRSSRNACRVTATEKAKHARTADEKVQTAEQVLVDVQAAGTGGIELALDVSTSVDDGTVPDEMISVSALNTEEASRPKRKRSGSASLQSDEPPKRLKLGPLKGWGVKRNGVIMSALEYAQNHWSEF
ncbi:hypothetical protein B0H14DRAFT_3476619 [Mycena olivaceomarginata]|nr:hypothetical protein B0H14DRAFT_3476619 [Mycena olivaceomarginata]